MNVGILGELRKVNNLKKSERRNFKWNAKRSEQCKKLGTTDSLGKYKKNPELWKEVNDAILRGMKKGENDGILSEK